MILLYLLHVVISDILWGFYQMQILESQMKIKQQQVTELESQASHLRQMDPDKEQEIVQKKVMIEER